MQTRKSRVRRSNQPPQQNKAMIKAIYKGEKYDILSVGENTYNLKGVGEVSISDINLYVDEFKVDDCEYDNANGTNGTFNVDVWYDQKGEFYSFAGSRTSPPEESYTVKSFKITSVSIEDEWGNYFEHPEYDAENLEGIIVGELDYSWLKLS